MAQHRAGGSSSAPRAVDALLSRKGSAKARVFAASSAHASEDAFFEVLYRDTHEHTRACVAIRAVVPSGRRRVQESRRHVRSTPFLAP
ncbi:hypothetical protein MRX96_004745 [Rhipicephalus microplus]